MKNKARLLILITPFLLFAVVTMMGSRDRTPVNTLKLQAILSQSTEASLFNIQNSGSELTLHDQTFYRGESAKKLVTNFRLSDFTRNKNVASFLTENYACTFSTRHKDGSTSQVAFIVVSYDPSSKIHYAHIEAPKLNGWFELEESAARDLNEIFAAHDARTATSSTQ